MMLGNFRFHGLSLAVAAVAGIVAGTGGAVANDSTARLELGGLVYANTTAIRIAEEDLYLSRDEVRVRYRFENVTDKDVSTLVAFPMPELVIGDDVSYSVEPTDPINFIGFTVAVNGEPVPVSVEARATRFGVDVTDILARHDIPVTLFTGDPDLTDALFQRLNNLPAAARAELDENGLIDWSTTFGAGEKPLANPHWRARVSFYWHQTFPAGATIEVEHRYRPVPSVFFLGPDQARTPSYGKEFCIDKGFVRGVERRAGSSEHGYLMGYELRYVLVTANNWLGPIGKFRLTIDKGNPDDLVSLCIDGIRKTGPTTFVHEAENFSPGGDLNILFASMVRR